MIVFARLIVHEFELLLSIDKCPCVYLDQIYQTVS